MKLYTLSEIAEHIGATIVNVNDSIIEDILISQISTLNSASKNHIAFLANKKYAPQLETTEASAVIISKECLENCKTVALVMDNPYLGYAMTAQFLDNTPKPADSIHPSAAVDASVQIAGNVAIGANAVIESGVVLEEGVCIGAGCFIGKNAIISANTALWANVSVYHNVIIGQSCLIQSNTVLGSDGFGYAKHEGKWTKIPQLGTVVIGDNVEIGASTTIDRGALENTEIHDGVILDNQIQIAHNVIIGENTAIAACSVIAGSTHIGKNCTIAGLVGINGHISVSDNAHFTGMTMVTKSIKSPGVYSSGMPAQDNREWRKMNARIKKLDSISKRLTLLEK